MVACEFNQMLGRYYDGALPAGQRAPFELHLATCADCSAELEQMRAISQTLRAQPMPRASSEFMARLESLASNVEDVTVLRFARRLTAAAAAILLAATLQFVLHSPASAPPVAAVQPSQDEQMIIDPAAAANNAIPDNSVALADTQLDPLTTDLSGGRP